MFGDVLARPTRSDRGRSQRIGIARRRRERLIGAITGVVLRLTAERLDKRYSENVRRSCRLANREVRHLVLQRMASDHQLPAAVVPRFHHGGFCGCR